MSLAVPLARHLSTSKSSRCASLLRPAQFFLKGTSLAQLAEEYDLVKVNIATIDTALRQKEVVLPEMKQTVRDAEKKVTAVEAGAALEQKLLAVEGELAWMLVAGKEEVGAASSRPLAEL